jgi:hypothetical protein
MKLGNFTVQRILEMVHPYVLPEDFSPEATPEAMAPYRHWLEPWSLWSIRRIKAGPYGVYICLNHWNEAMERLLGPRAP